MQAKVTEYQTHSAVAPDHQLNGKKSAMYPHLIDYDMIG